MKDKKKIFVNLFVALMILLVFAQTFYGVHKKSVTWDELCYIGAGKYILKTGNFGYNALVYHPPLSFYINSMFIYFLKFDDDIYKKDECFGIGNRMIFHSQYNPKIIVWWWILKSTLKIKTHKVKIWKEQF